MVQVGIKKKIGCRWTLSSKFKVKKMVIKKCVKYEQLMKGILTEFGVKRSVTDCVLLSASHEVIGPENFTIQSFRRYIGTCRVYVGLTRQYVPTQSADVTFSEAVSYLRMQQEMREASPDPSAIIGDDTAPYSDSVKIRLFMYDHELDFPLASTKRGNFHLLPANHKHQLRKYRHEKMGLCVLQTPASVYFIREVLKQQLEFL